MNKYTIIYGLPHGHMQTIHFERIETNDISKFFADYKHKDTTHFVFEGWPKQEGEK